MWILHPTNQQNTVVCTANTSLTCMLPWNALWEPKCVCGRGSVVELAYSVFADPPQLYFVFKKSEKEGRQKNIKEKRKRKRGWCDLRKRLLSGAKGATENARLENGAQKCYWLLCVVLHCPKKVTHFTPCFFRTQCISAGPAALGAPDLRRLHVPRCPVVVLSVIHNLRAVCWLLIPHRVRAYDKKTTELYWSVLERVRDLVPEFQPRQVIADFEEDPTAAMRDVFGPDVWLLVSFRSSFVEEA